MNVEYTLTSHGTKARVIQALRDAGHSVSPGPIRLAYPFTVLVNVGHDGLESAWRIVRGIDPCVGQVVGPAAPAATVG